MQVTLRAVNLRRVAKKTIKVDAYTCERFAAMSRSGASQVSPHPARPIFQNVRDPYWDRPRRKRRVSCRAQCLRSAPHSIFADQRESRSADRMGGIRPKVEKDIPEVHSRHADVADCPLSCARPYFSGCFLSRIARWLESVAPTAWMALTASTSWSSSACLQGSKKFRKRFLRLPTSSALRQRDSVSIEIPAPAAGLSCSSCRRAPHRQMIFWICGVDLWARPCFGTFRDGIEVADRSVGCSGAHRRPQPRALGALGCAWA